MNWDAKFMLNTSNEYDGVNPLSNEFQIKPYITYVTSEYIINA
jgi:hypothetical protein